MSYACLPVDLTAVVYTYIIMSLPYHAVRYTEVRFNDTINFDASDPTNITHLSPPSISTEQCNICPYMH